MRHIIYWVHSFYYSHKHINKNKHEFLYYRNNSTKSKHAYKKLWDSFQINSHHNVLTNISMKVFSLSVAIILCRDEKEDPVKLRISISRRRPVTTYWRCWSAASFTSGATRWRRWRRTWRSSDPEFSFFSSSRRHMLTSQPSNWLVQVSADLNHLT